MSKKQHKIVKELDPASVKGATDLQKKHYLTLGYKPYRMVDGRTKWLTEAQRVYHETKAKQKPATGKRKPKKHGESKWKRRRRNRVLLFIRDNWLILLLLAISLIAIIIVMR